MKEVIDKIKKMRSKAGLTHENMANAMKLTQVSYTKIENGTTKLTVDRLFQIAKILEVEVAEILEIDQKLSMNQTNKDSSTGFLQKIENFYQENIETYEKLIASKDEQISLLNQLLASKDNR